MKILNFVYFVMKEKYTGKRKRVRCRRHNQRAMNFSSRILPTPDREYNACKRTFIIISHRRRESEKEGLFGGSRLAKLTLLAQMEV